MEVEKALVDPVLMPMVRPVLDWISKHVPKFWRIPTRAKDKIRSLAGRSARPGGDAGGDAEQAKKKWRFKGPSFTVVNPHVYGQ